MPSLGLNFATEAIMVGQLNIFISQQGQAISKAA
jgi:hypothetical protein